MSKEIAPKNLKSQESTVGSIIKQESGADKLALYEKILGKEKLKIKLKTKQEIAGLKIRVRNNDKPENFEQRANALKDYLEKLKQRKSFEAQIRGLKDVNAIIGNVETFNDLRKLDVATLIKLEDRYEGLLLYLFTDLEGGSGKVDFKNWKGYKNLRVGQRFRVNFRGHIGAYNEIGAADMLNIHVTGIRTYANGNPKKVRDSDTRIGLKGRNEDESGFYDELGYMRILTSDVMEITSLDHSMHDRYRKKVNGVHQPLNEDSYKKYNASKRGRANKRFMRKARSVPASYSLKRARMSPEKVLAYRKMVEEKMGSLEGLSAADRILKVVKFFAKKENGMYARHCGDFARRVKAIAGVRKQRSILFDLSYAKVDGRWKSAEDRSRRVCNYSTAKIYRLARMARPGDHVWCNNQNRFDKFGNHSGVITEIDYERGTYTLASWFGNQKHRQKLSRYTFKKRPIVYIARPV